VPHVARKQTRSTQRPQRYAKEYGHKEPKTAMP
jgi:hypothetical protein